MHPVIILHSADLHLGYRQYGYALREGDFYKAAQQVFEKAVQHDVDAILLAGDTFDSTKPSATAVWVMQEFVSFVRGRGIRVLGIDGNHDASDSNWLRICGIEPLNDVVAVVKSRKAINDEPAIELRIGGINNTRPTQFYQQVTNYQANGPVHILAVHQALAELTDFPVQDYTALQMASALKPLGVKYVALGDIHVYRETVIGGVRFAYPGSTEVNAVDEPKDKTVSLITYNGEQISTSMIPLKTRQFITCSLESDADVDRIVAQTTVKAGDDSPFVVGWYRADKRDIAKRVEDILRMSNVMYRITPYTGEHNTLQATATYERRGALLQLNEAVSAFFDEKTDESELVFQFLGAPDDVRNTAQRYAKSKGL
jgi:DNA repair exonuclease SbcCD nuclease subunit